MHSQSWPSSPDLSALQSPIDSKDRHCHCRLYVTSPCIYLECSDSRIAVVDCRGQKTLPSLRVIFVGKLASTKFYIQHPISGQDGPDGHTCRYLSLTSVNTQMTKSMHEISAAFETYIWVLKVTEIKFPLVLL